MKRLGIFLISVLLVLVALDFLAKYLIDRYTDTHILPGDCASIDYSIKAADEDVIILGNSRVLNSLMPTILSDSLGLSVYNAASNGQMLPFFHSIQEAILNRHSPKALIIGIDEQTMSDSGIGERYNILAPYYGKGYNMIDSCMSMGGWSQKIMVNSTFYRYNNIWWRILLYHFVSDKNHSKDGFISKPIPPHEPKLVIDSTKVELNPERFFELKEMVKSAVEKEISVILLKAPQYVIRYDNLAINKKIRELADAYPNVWLVDDESDSLFLSRPDLFFDSGHLNYKGAEIYSRIKASQISKYLTTRDITN